MKRVLLAMVAFLGAGVAHADWVSPFPVGKIEVGPNGIYFYKPAGVASYPNTFGCSNSDWVFIDGATPFANRALAVALAAQAQAKTIHFNLVGCVGPYLQATHLAVNPG